MKKRTLNKLMALGLAASMVLSMAACGSSGDTKEQGTAESTTASADDTATADADSGDKIVVGVDLYYRRDEYYVDLETTFRAYGEEKGYEMVISDADGDVTTQISQIEDFITQGVDVILLAAADPTALIPACQDAIDAGIPVICYDGGIDSDIPATKVIFDYYEDGAMVAEWAKQYITDNLGGKAKVAILDFPASPIVCGLRAQGFAETISQLDGVEIVAQQDRKAKPYRRNGSDGEYPDCKSGRGSGIRHQLWIPAQALHLQSRQQAPRQWYAAMHGDRKALRNCRITIRTSSVFARSSLSGNPGSRRY